MGERRRERNKTQTPICCLSHTPSWGPGPQPRHVPWLGIKPVTFRFRNQCSMHWATPARANLGFYVLVKLPTPSEVLTRSIVGESQKQDVEKETPEQRAWGGDSQWVYMTLEAENTLVTDVVIVSPNGGKIDWMRPWLGLPGYRVTEHTIPKEATLALGLFWAEDNWGTADTVRALCPPHPPGRRTSIPLSGGAPGRCARRGKQPSSLQVDSAPGGLHTKLTLIFI